MRSIDSGPLHLIYDYRRNGNVEALTDTRGGGYSQGFVYDSLDRLTTVSGMAAGTFTYDDLGNRLSKNGNAYTYSGPFLMSDGVQSFTYDSGNTIAAGPSAFEYTPYNMLAKATTSGVSTNYRYDADNQRRMRIAGDTRSSSCRGRGSCHWPSTSKSPAPRPWLHALTMAEISRLRSAPVPRRNEQAVALTRTCCQRRPTSTVRRS